MSRHPSVVAVDVGTSAVRAALVVGEHGTLRSTRVDRRSDAGGRVFDAEELWADVCRALRDLESDDAAPAALAFSAHIGAVAIDRDLRAVGSAGGWADARGVDRLLTLPASLLADLLTTAGRPVAAGGGLAYALELAASASAHDVSAIVSPKDFLIARLCGAIVTDTIDAAYTGASDVRGRRWQDVALESAGVPSRWFPAQVDPSEIVGEVDAVLAAELRLPPRLPVIAGGPDGSVGAGILLGPRTDAIADIGGTTDVVVRRVADARRPPPSAVVNPALDGREWTIGGPTGATGGAVAWWRERVGPVAESEWSSLGAGGAGIRLFPSMSGERFPRWRPLARGAAIGWGPEHEPAHLVRAALEGAAFTVREALDTLDPERLLPVLFAGGSARSAEVARLRAAIFGREVHVAADPDATLLGAAGLAFLGAGVASDLEHAQELLRVRFSRHRPDEATAARYDEIFVEWAAMRDQIAS
ncbi:FGGY-family carbohydrate kinase [Microbacterium sp. NPDC091313]